MGVIEQYQDQILMILGAHVHTTDIRSPKSANFPNVTTPILMAPSISPIHSNNPGYSVLDFTEQGGQISLKNEMRFFQLG